LSINFHSADLQKAGKNHFLGEPAEKKKWKRERDKKQKGIGYCATWE